MSHDKIDPSDLPELPDSVDMEALPELPDLPELPELPELKELPPLPEEAAPSKPTPVKAAPKPAPKPVVKPAAKPKVVRPPEGAAPEATPPKPTAPKPKAPAAAPAPVASLVEETPSAAPEPSPEPTAAAVPAPVLADGEQPPLRVLDRAPAHVLLASKIVVGGALLPFMVYTSWSEGGSALMSFAAKAIALAAAWVWLQQVLHNFGPKKPGLVGTLADLNFKPKPKQEEEGKEKRAKRGGPAKSVTHPFPSALHLLSLVLVGVALYVSTLDPRQGTLGPVGLTETALLAWAGFAFVHVRSYERWGSFNPLFPLMFLGMLFSGVASVVAGFGSEGIWMAAQVLGGLAVGGGGGLATYAIVEAMMAAKKEGDLKKAEELERRRAARESRRKEKG